MQKMKLNSAQKNTVEQYFKKINAGEFDEEYFDLFTDDVELYYPKFGFAKGRDGIKQFGAVLGSYLKELIHNIEHFNYIISDKFIVVEGAEAGITKDGKIWPDNQISFGKFCNVFEFKENSIKRVHIYVDPDFTSEDVDRIAVFHSPIAENKKSSEQQTKTVVEAFFNAILVKNPIEKRDKLSSLFADEVDWDIPGNKDKFAWLGPRKTNANVISFFEEHNVLVEQIKFEIEFTAFNGENAITNGQLSSKILENGEIYNSEFVIIITVKYNKIIRYHFLEDSYKLNDILK